MLEFMVLLLHPESGLVSSLIYKTKRMGDIDLGVNCILVVIKTMYRKIGWIGKKMKTEVNYF